MAGGAVPLEAQPVGSGNIDSYQQIRGTRGVLPVNAGISNSQARELARRCGLTGYRPLPTEIQKSLRCGHAVPHGIPRRLVPVVMLCKLPEPQGYEWRIAGNDLILVNWAGGVVVEILRGVFE